MAEDGELKLLSRDPQWFDGDDLYRFEASLGALPAAVYISDVDWDELLLAVGDDREAARVELARLARDEAPSHSASGIPHFRVRYTGAAPH
jgi:hypothetical protein